MAAKMLQVVNSVCFGLPRDITMPAEAVMQLERNGRSLDAELDRDYLKAAGFLEHINRWREDCGCPVQPDDEPQADKIEPHRDATLKLSRTIHGFLQKAKLGKRQYRRGAGYIRPAVSMRWMFSPDIKAARDQRAAPGIADAES